jgi:outer membrane autotransporter protein
MTVTRLRNRAHSRARLFACVSAVAMAGLATPSFALNGQQVIDFYVDGTANNDVTNPGYGTTPGAGYATGCCNTYHGPAYSGAPGHLAPPAFPGAFATTSSGPGAISEANGDGVGVTGHTANDTYDGYGGVGLVGQDNFGGLTVTRQVDVTHGGSGATTPITTSFVNAGVPNAARWVETITNNTGSTITGTFAYFTNLGSDANTHWYVCPTGCTTSKGNSYLVSGPSDNTQDDPIITHILGNNAYTQTQVTPHYANGNDNPEWDYSISVAPGQTVRIVLFNVVTAGLNYDPNNRTPEIELGQQLADLIINNNQPLLFSSPFFTGLTQSELQTVLNFDFGSGTIDLSQPFFIQTDSPLLTDPATFDGGTLKPTTTYAFNQDFTVNSAGGTIDNTNGDLTFSHPISGPGGLTFTGGHTTTLLAQNTYLGPTTVSGGVLQAGGTGAFSSSSAFTVGAAGTLDLNGISQTIGSLAGSGAVTLGSATLTTGGDNSSTTFSGVISGAGGLTKTGTGAFTLSGSGTYSAATTVSAGTLKAGAANAFSAASSFSVASGATLDLNGFNQAIGSLSGAGSVTLGSGVLTADGDNGSTTFSGVISGAGGLTKTGTGVFTLSGDNTYTGATTVSGGVLDVNGSISGSTVTVGTDGMLKGHGQLGGLNLTSGSTVAPGNSIGTLHVAGNVTFGAGSIYQVEANSGGQADLIDATGHATINGGKVQVLAANGNYALQRTYTILTATGGVTGTFADVTSNLAFLDADLTYTPTAVDLVLTRNDVDFTTVALTPNQRAVAARIQPGGSHSALYSALLLQTPEGARVGFDALSGEIHASLRSSLIQDAGPLRRAVLGRLQQAPYEDATDSSAALGDGGPRNGKGPGALTVWGSSFGDWDRVSGDGNAGGVLHNSSGFTMGADYKVGQLVWLGLAGGYIHSDANVGSRQSQSRSDAGHVAGYGVLASDGFSLRGGGIVSWGDSRVTRQVEFPGFSDKTLTTESVQTDQAFGELGYAWKLKGAALESFGGVNWVRATAGGFTEMGGAAALSGQGASTDLTFTTLGVRAASSVTASNGTVITPKLSVAWQHAFGALTPAQAETILSTGQSFTALGAPLDRNQVLIQAGVGAQLTRQTRVSLTYDGELSERISEHGVRAGVSVAF